MIVMKFGGTSLGDAERIQRVAALVHERLDRRPFVVTSALGGVTNDLLAAIDAAQAGDRAGVDASVKRLVARHDDVVGALALPPELDQQAHAALRQAFAHLGDLTQGVLLLGECSPRSRDAVAALGEMISHRLVALALRARGIEAAPVDPRSILRTDEHFGEALPKADAIEALAQEHVAPLLAQGVVPVTGGFVGSTDGGVTTTLGRGGSDLSATLLGVALDAEEVLIWTDVDGLMTADPRVVPAARTLPEASFAEASELAWFGARVLHPATIKPAIERRIPVRILNTFRPDGRGTLVSEAPVDAAGMTPCVRAVAWKEGITLISVDTPHMLGAIGFLSRVFAVFERHRTPVDVVTTSEVNVSMTVDRADRLPAITRDLAEIAQVRVEPGMGLACVVGRGFLESPQLASRVLGALDDVPLRMMSLGSSGINLSVVVAQERVRDVVRRVHARFLEEAG